MSKLGPITKGEATVRRQTSYYSHKFFPVVTPLFPEAPPGGAEWDAAWFRDQNDATLYADAHNTANRTGKLPSELEAELRQAIATLQDIADLSIGSDKVSDANQLAFAKEHAAKFIAKSTGK